MNKTDKCFLIADPEGGAWDFANDIYENLNKRIPGIFYLNELHITRHNNQEIEPKIKNNLRRSYCFYIADSNLNPQEWFTQLSLVNQTLKNSSAQEIIDVLPNLYYSRQDRKDKPRVPISSKVVADMIGLYADRVLTLDVHSQQIQGFYNIPFDSLPSFRTVANYLQENHSKILKNDELTIVSPDAGGGKRAESFAKKLGKKNVSIGYKIRNDLEVETIKFPKEQIEGKDIFLIDDIGDSFGTIKEACDELKKNGAKKIYAYCTHAFFTKGYKPIQNLEKLFIGDSIKQPYNKKYKPNKKEKRKLETISFAPLFADAIYNISAGESISDLFR